MRPRRSFLRSLVAAVVAAPIFCHLVEATGLISIEEPPYEQYDKEFMDWVHGFKENERWKEMMEVRPWAHQIYDPKTGATIDQFVSDVPRPSLLDNVLKVPEPPVKGPSLKTTIFVDQSKGKVLIGQELA